MSMGKGFHVSGGPAGTYWNPSNTATGNFTLKGTFTLVKPSNHTNYYGLVFGGNALDGPIADLHLLPGRAERHVPDQAAQRRADQRRSGRHSERRHQDAGQLGQIRQRARSPRRRRHDLVRRQRHGRAHHAEERREDRRHRRLPRQSRARSDGGRLRGPERDSDRRLLVLLLIAGASAPGTGGGLAPVPRPDRSGPCHRARSAARVE